MFVHVVYLYDICMMGIRLNFPQHQASPKAVNCPSTRDTHPHIAPYSTRALFASISLDHFAVVQNQLHDIMYGNSKCEKLEPHLSAVMSHGFQSQLNQPIRSPPRKSETTLSRSISIFGYLLPRG